MEAHEYHGIVLNRPADQIPIMLAQETLRVGSMTLWEYQFFVNHVDEPSADDYPQTIEEAEIGLLNEWKTLLGERFPGTRFIAWITPTVIMSWYQVTKGAPIEDDMEWTLYKTVEGPIKTREEAIAEVMAVVDRYEGWTREAKLAEYGSILAGHDNRPLPRDGGEGTCESCRVGTEFTEPVVSPVHRGIRTIQCKHCGAALTHSTRIIREKINFR